MHTWNARYSRDGDYLVLCDEPWWTVVVEFLGLPFIRYGFTYGFGSWIMNLGERGRRDVLLLPLPDELSDPWWREGA